MQPIDKFTLITRNLAEYTNEKKLKEILEERNLKIYWGTAITGMPHIAYMSPLLKIKDFLDAECEVKILLADIHGLLDNQKSTFEQVDDRTKFYKKLLTTIFKVLKVKKMPEFVIGSSFQLKSDYTFDAYRLMTITTKRNAKKANSEVVRQINNPLVSSLIYPLLQALDEEYLGVDCQFGGVDQRKIFMYAKKHLPKINYKERIHLMNKMIAGLNSDKMSSSDEYSKINLLEPENKLRKKVKKGFCEERNTNCGLFELTEKILFPVSMILSHPIEIIITEEETKIYESFDILKKDFENGDVHPGDFKEMVFTVINRIIDPIRREFDDDTELIERCYGKQK